MLLKLVRQTMGTTVPENGLTNYLAEVMKLNCKTLSFAAAAIFSQFLFIQTIAAQSSPNLYKVIIRLDGVTTNDFGRLIGVFAEKGDIVRRCAIENGISSGGLVLVYDRDADALEVVNRTNAAVVCSPFVFSGGFSLSSATGRSRERLTFTYLEGSGEASGTLRATERFTYDSNGNVIGFSLTGKLQFALTPSDRSSKIYSGFLTTGPRFFPSTR
jgi:hypothetical protein